METLEAVQQQIQERKSSRRSALLMGGAALAGLALSRHAVAQAAAITDADILNFALNLEYLEAQFYTLATAGVTIDKLPSGSLPITGAGTAGTVTVKSNPMVPFVTASLKSYAMELATEERNHVAFLQSALGSAAVAMPNIDLMNSFNTLAQAAGLGSTFDPFASEANFLLGAFIFEDVGVTAYHGAAALLQSAGNLDAASGIMATEAYHAGAIRTQILLAGSAAQQASQSIAAARAKLDGTNNDDIGVSIVNGAATIADVDSNALAFSRTTTQVLSIVYGGQTGGGVFYPNGMNGTIK